ncbi:MAG: hypothetical protein ACD_2C00263G0005 [uncultured bacterium (gcode 4)]|uniref:Uncharacterized protein n=1 Tax=uncultured bacterium (gcode 4) TaxID=1234023 RepID=K2GF52_9BACT|nr:MAG: hypothetical protein ACD_2C00263G0005 [uncultured bacterium (gcode 4)]
MQIITPHPIMDEELWFDLDKLYLTNEKIYVNFCINCLLMAYLST